MKILKQYYFLGIAALFLFGALEVNRSLTKPLLVIPKQDSTWNLNSEMIKNFNLGFRRLGSSFLWISTIIESDIDHYKKKDLNSWMFLRFNSISELEPKFYENYSFGGMYLSIIKDDLPGASLLYNKGLRYYGDDFSLLRDAGFHFYFEAKDYKRAYEITQTAKKYHPKKFALMGMTTRLEAENGKLEDALSTLNTYQKIYPRGTFFGDRIFQNRYSLKAEIDLNCLSQKKNGNCSLHDLNGLPYIKSAGRFIAQSKWSPYRRKSSNEKKN